MMSDHDERLASIFEYLLDTAAEGTRADRLTQAVVENPDLEQEIRELAATAMIANDVASFQFGDLSAALKATIISGDNEPAGSGNSSSTLAQGGIGSKIGEYELLEEIGRGGMGVVFRARQSSLGRDVALKMIPNAEFATSDDLARLRLEALAAGQLSHPNVVPVYDVGDHGGHPWFCMKYIEGETLNDRLMNGPMGAQDAVRLLLPVVDAIQTAHAEGILHRDLKPSNILIDHDGTPFVTDFGLAKRTRSTTVSQKHTNSGHDSSITKTGAILGTPAWMSPEQAAGQTATIGHASDIYSLGAILYAMLTGRPPFQATTPYETLVMVIEQELVSVRIVNPSIDTDLEMIVTKCLQKPRDLRYSAASDLANDLRAWLNNDPVSARSSTFASILTRLFRDSHQVSVLQNWGVLWMWHSLVLLVLCITTNVIQLMGVESRWPYLGLWILGLGLWALIFWNLRRRSGPVTAVERQIAHVWGGSMAVSSLLFGLEYIMNRPVLEFSPVLGAIAGMVFLVKAGTLSGIFYVPALVLFATSPLMAMIQQSSLPNLSITLFGMVSALSFFLPGLKYYREKSERSRVLRQTE
jgi:serine/threonine protein kinase